MTRARVTEGLLAALGTLAAAWPLTTLLTGEHWLWRLILLVLLVSGLGMAARATGTARGVVVLTQVTGLLLVVFLLDLEQHLGMHALAQQIAGLIEDANHTLVTYTAPAPVTPGLEFVLSLIVPTLAIAVDLLAVTFRRPAAAGIPLLGVFMLSASNAATGLNPAYFVAVAVIWLSMVAHGSSRQMLSWASTRARPSTPMTFENRFNISGHAALARGLGVASLVLALVLPAALPSSTPHFFANGLSRSTDSGGSGPGSMFGSEADIAKDLRAQGTAPVLVFRTNDASPPPLRVLATSRYTGGQWNLRPPSTHLVRGRDNTKLQTDGTATTAASQTYSLQVSSSTIGAPQFAAPFPVRTANLGSVPWRFDGSTGQIVPSGPASSYSLTYERLGDDDQPSGSGGRPNAADELALPTEARARVVALAEKIGGRTSFDSAIAIQDYLRSGSFTYSLSLAPRRKASDGRPLDPLSNFLVTRKGYCIQFATAMIMLARADGIPARLAVGFLPGQQDSSGAYHVVKSDAHAWPELWFPGMGWTRFEPTPGARSGAPPLYAIPTQPDQALSSPSPSASAPTPSRRAPVLPAAPTSHATTDSGLGVWSTVGIGVLVALVILLLLLILPGLAWARRHRIVSGSAGRTNRLEAEWTVLQSRLDDLGIAAPDDRSPRALEDYYRRRGELGSPRDDDALHRAARTLERARYAPPGDRPQSLAKDSQEVLRQVRAGVPSGQRVKAWLLPATGRRAVSGALRAVAALPTRLLRRRRPE
ncbi:transglutaminaseTgpA domain-containing protein [Leekyejoonella antrihumi]|nr:DUF3488 and transglutaminase-like domain-containing protein [Leekyejoonella antrihumi]